MSTPYQFTQGRIPLLISIPHMGQEIPEALQARMTQAGLQIPDTDWHMDRLYTFANEMGASVLQATYSRYVVDLNRSPTDEHLYPGQTKTGLCPEHTFRGDAIYQAGDSVSDEEKAQRVTQYWQPYHQKLQETLEQLRSEHGQVLLWDAHSIASVLPRLFPGKLPDLNIGTSGGASCDQALLNAVEASLVGCPFEWVSNGRFKGGYITRQYGNPAQGIHTIQLEMCQSLYMNETHPFEYRDDLAQQVAPTVRQMVQAAYDALETL